MWFLWGMITFLIVIFSTSQLISYCVCFYKYPKILDGMPRENKNIIIFGICLHCAINLAWIILIFSTSIWEYGWACLISALIALCFIIPSIKNGDLSDDFARLTGCKHEKEVNTEKKFDNDIIQKDNNKQDVNQTKYCSYCGQRIDINSKFCKYCGKEQK